MIISLIQLSFSLIHYFCSTIVAPNKENNKQYCIQQHLKFISDAINFSTSLMLIEHLCGCERFLIFFLVWESFASCILLKMYPVSVYFINRHEHRVSWMSANIRLDCESYWIDVKEQKNSMKMWLQLHLFARQTHKCICSFGFHPELIISFSVL